MSLYRRSDPSTGFAIVGGVLGAVAGGVVADRINRPPPRRECREDVEGAAAIGCAFGAAIVSEVEEAGDQFVAVAAGVLAGGVLGALGGRRLGRSRVTVGWRPVRRATVSVRPKLRGQLRFGMTVR